MERVEFLECPFDPVTIDQAVKRCEQFIRSGRPHRVVVVNAAKIVKMDQDAELADIVRSADLITADGMAVVWASRLLRQPLPERVAGVDLMDRLVERAAVAGHRVFFFGAREEIAREAVATYQRRYPKLQVAGWRHGYFGPEDEAAIAEQIRTACPDILFVALGTPAKEFWIARHFTTLDVPLCHGVGGGFDVVAGFVRRAPAWMQAAGLEWLWRTLQEPRRMWRRYLMTNTLFLIKLMRAWFTVARTGHARRLTG
jgi:N-acetylglucosaminyldiphosphoundecaprenol N-acetyl-beta-D-mannosaminyltransferase